MLTKRCKVSQINNLPQGSAVKLHHLAPLLKLSRRALPGVSVDHLEARLHAELVAQAIEPAPRGEAARPGGAAVRLAARAHVLLQISPGALLNQYQKKKQ
jgi:hypothetical protein